MSSVCTIIAARNASSTIAAAISSALNDPHVSEVIVVDDASTDATADTARASDDGSGRLKVIRFDINKGPAAARNYAIECSSAPIISVLDADDFFIEGRFAQLLSVTNWDIIADNIVFIREQSLPDFDRRCVPRFGGAPWALDLATFAERNISSRHRQRGELGFLKPLIRREFLTRHNLRYNENLRLGEDYDLYAWALAFGARFLVISNCGYGAVVRSDSLSGRHSTGDLKNLAEAAQLLLKSGILSRQAARAVGAHARHVRSKYDHRRFLDVKARQGLAAAVVMSVRDPATILPIAHAILLDKYGGLARLWHSERALSGNDGKPRYLFDHPTI
ncbi:glycosyltransferase family 2 protein [Phyllobacterium zundukense]|uniref:glycosyltransferase family 2 protein n=1 Tax=Phyllobacterium zundukense TaxID=1867719 RepID=UPI000C582059|nr:glycosyltransferase family 2 protein [Phyllobacterium zundukense]ATU92283.1 glycosyl transferase family A [Phyllobacterium zundukense]